MSHPTDFSVTIYSRPGCTRCTATKMQVAKMGIEPVERQIDDHPEMVESLAAAGPTSLPLVEVTYPDGTTDSWTDMRIDKLHDLRDKVKASAKV